MRPVLVAHAPTRLDFGGGWTDVPPFPEERGGFVCNLAIERRATVTLSAANEPGVSIVQSAEGTRGDALVHAACAAANVTSVKVQLSSDFPFGAGLGGSSAAGVALAAALARWNGAPLEPSGLAEWSRKVEVRGLKMAGGFQDHYAAAFGGALGLTFGATREVEQIPLAPETIAELESQCLLLYTGESRISGETINAVLDAYKNRVPKVLQALDRMKALAIHMRDALKLGDVNALGGLVGEHWQHQRALNPRITTERIDAIDAAAREAGAIGMKALGASGGGCVLVFASAGGADRIAKAVAPFAERLTWRVARTGVHVREEMPLSHARVEG